jgi:hypothetical protein
MKCDKALSLTTDTGVFEFEAIRRNHENSRSCWFLPLRKLILAMSMTTTAFVMAVSNENKTRNDFVLNSFCSLDLS